MIKKILTSLIFICASLIMKAQYIEQPVVAADSVNVEYAETNASPTKVNPETIVQIAWPKYEEINKQIKLGQQEFLIGSSFFISGITIAGVPYIVANSEYRDYTGTDIGLFYTGAGLTAFGIIYIAVGLSNWCQGSKKINNIYLTYSPSSFSINF